MNNQYQNYPIAPERRSEILRSLREHGLTTVDGVLCWTDNTTGEVISVDLDFFWACGIDLRLHIDPTTTEHAEESTRKALERLAAWCKQRELNDRIRDDTREKFVFLELKRKNTQIGIQNIDFSTLARLCTLSAYLEYANKKTKKVKTDKQTKSDAQDDSMEVTTECEKPPKVVNESADKKEKEYHHAYRKQKPCASH